MGVLVLFSLMGAWTGQIAHLLLVPHHYCFAHDEISHEDEHDSVDSGWQSTASLDDDHCSILGNFLRSGTLTPTSGHFDQVALRAGGVRELLSFSFVTPDLFLLAPKNSPPAFV